MTNTDTNFKNGGGVERPKGDDGVFMNNNDEEKNKEMETVNLASHNNDGVTEAATRFENIFDILLFLTV
jgi:hypothetical protein